MHKKHTSPLARVVRRIPDSWEPVVATTRLDDYLTDAVWSPCNRLIAVAITDLIQVLDAVTLSPLSIFDLAGIYCGGSLLLGFSPDSRSLTLYTGGELISWDLQTGGPCGTIYSFLDHQYTQPLSFKHSKDGKVVAVAYKSPHGYILNDEWDTFICTYDLLSRERMASHHVLEGPIVHPIWTHDGYLRFATIDPKFIRIWQSPFTLEHPPVEVASFPVPDGIYHDDFPLPPYLSLLAFVLRDTIQAWDLKASELLLKSELTQDKWTHAFKRGGLSWDSFSSDGRFFVYRNFGEVCVYKESPAGYLLHQRLPFSTAHSPPRLSPNGESIIIPVGSIIHRSHTRDQVLSLPSVPTMGSSIEKSTLGFSPDNNFAAFARKEGKTVITIDLQSGEPKWKVDMGVEIECLGVTGGTIIVVGDNSIVTWNLPSGDRTFNASVNDIARVTIHGRLRQQYYPDEADCMSISPDPSRIVLATCFSSVWGLEVYDVSTGWCLTWIKTHAPLSSRFTQDGREVWVWDNDEPWKREHYEITEDSESGTIEIKHQRTPPRPRGFYQESSRGYTVTDDWWVLSPSQKRLLWLPHRWRMGEKDRAWGGRFLGLLSCKLSEVAIVEFLE